MCEKCEKKLEAAKLLLKVIPTAIFKEVGSERGIVVALEARVLFEKAADAEVFAAGMKLARELAGAE